MLGCRSTSCPVDLATCSTYPTRASIAPVRLYLSARGSKHFRRVPSPASHCATKHRRTSSERSSLHCQTALASAITLVPLQPSDFGSCVKAIALGQVITCPDVECDTSFDPVWRKVCLEHGLRAVQSRPIIVAGKPRGTFVIAYRQPKPESDWDVALMQFAASAAGEAMEASKRNAAPEAAE